MIDRDEVPTLDEDETAVEALAELSEADVHRGLSVVPLCPFVRAYLRRHPEDADLVASR